MENHLLELCSPYGTDTHNKINSKCIQKLNKQTNKQTNINSILIEVHKSTITHPKIPCKFNIHDKKMLKTTSFLKN